MNLYTIIISFPDHTFAIEQQQANDVKGALSEALRNAKSLKDVDRKAIEDLISDKLRLTHVAENKRGVWIWHHMEVENEAVRSILGGVVVQTDVDGPLRLW